MRIAFVVSTLARTGPVNVLFDQVSNLRGEHELAIFTLSPEPIDSRFQDFEQLGVEVTCVFQNRVSSFLLGRFVLRRTLTQFSPDIVNLHGYRAYLLCRSLDEPTVATVHNRIDEDFRSTYGFLRGFLMAMTEVGALRKMDCVVSCSASNAEFLKERHQLSSVAIRNGVDQSVYKPPAVLRKLELRSNLGYSSACVTFVSTGGCSELKRTLDLIAEFKKICAENPVELHILGGGPLLEACKTSAASTGRISIHGPLEDPIPYLQAADCFVSLSSSEGMPLAVLEALSCGIPALLSDIPSHQEIHQLASEDGSVRLFGESPRELRDGVSSVLAERPDFPHFVDRALLGAERMAKAYEQVFAEVKENSNAR